MAPEDAIEHNHKELKKLNVKGYGYVFILTEDNDIGGSPENYENSEELEKLAIDTPNGKIYPFRVEL